MAFFTIMLLEQLYVIVGNSHSYETKITDRIISLRNKVWVHKTSSIVPLFIEVFVLPILEMECVYIYGSGEHKTGVDVVE